MDETPKKEAPDEDAPSNPQIDYSDLMITWSIVALVVFFIVAFFVVRGQEDYSPPRAEASASDERQDRKWYSPDVNNTECIALNHSPADRIRSLRNEGIEPRIRDLPGGAVEVIRPVNTFQEAVSTYYPSEAACNAALPRMRAIPDRYR